MMKDIALQMHPCMTPVYSQALSREVIHGTFQAAGEATLVYCPWKFIRISRQLSDTLQAMMIFGIP
jgi:hypothetical protein